MVPHGPVLEVSHQHLLLPQLRWELALEVDVVELAACRCSGVWIGSGGKLWTC